MSLSWTIPNLESAVWTPNWSADINPEPPESFKVQPGPGGLQIFCASTKPYGGALASSVFELKSQLQSPKIIFSYTATLDQSITYGQVLETDSKFTDADGWTYDGSLQFVVVNGYMIQVGDPWRDTGVKIPLSIGHNAIQIVYGMDFVKHTINMESVNGKPLNQKPVPATQIGWQKSTIVSQLQLCTGANGGAYDVLFSAMSYQGLQ